MRPNCTFIAALWCFILLMYGSIVKDASAQTPPADPVLRIATGMHTAPIRSIAVDRAGRYLVTGSDDKTVRVWDARDGTLLRTIRPPLGSGNEGKIFAVAITPDGATIACGGFTGSDGSGEYPIYLFDRATGTLQRRLTGLPSVTTALVISPDGRLLAATLGVKNGVRLFRLSDGALVGKDIDYGNSSYSADFDSSGSRLVTVCYDGFIRLYEVSATGLRLTTNQGAPGGSRPLSVRFSPEGTRVAVGYADTTKVSVLSATDLALRFSPDTTGVTNGALGHVCWSADGRYLFAGSTARDSNGQHFFRRWSDSGVGSFTDIPLSSNTLFSPCSVGDALWYASGGRNFGAIMVSIGTRRFTRTPDTQDLIGTALLVTEDGAGAQLSTPYGAKYQARFDLFHRDYLVRTEANATNFSRGVVTKPAVTNADGLVITDWNDTRTPKCNGTPLTLQMYEMARSLAIAPDAGSFLLGTEWYLRCFARDGKERWLVAAPSITWGVNVTGDGRVGVAAFGDGTIRWFRMRDGKELVAFFPHADGKRWVCWTPSGYYDCSTGAEDLIGWHLNRGAATAADFFPASRFRDLFYSPEIFKYILTTLDEVEAKRFADVERGRNGNQGTVTAVLPPVITIVSPTDLTEIGTPTVTIRYRVRTPEDAPVTAVRALVDGRPATDIRGQDFTADTANNVREIIVPMPATDCEIAIVAENKNALSAPAKVRLRWQKSVPLVPGALLKPKLYVLAVGVGAYKSSTIKPLTYPAKDAKDFVTTVKKLAGGLYREVVVYKDGPITDTIATRDEVVDGLEWIQRETTSRDVAMVFFAGHGANDSSRTYHFLPNNFDPMRFKSTGVSRSDIESTLKLTAGVKYFFFDTCDSGNVLGGQSRGVPDISGWINEITNAESGVVVFCASAKSQSALEDEKWKNGAFTKALIEGMTGVFDPLLPPQKDAKFCIDALKNSQRATISLLDAYIVERVKELTQGRQTPTKAAPETMKNLTITTFGIQ